MTANKLFRDWVVGDLADGATQKALLYFPKAAILTEVAAVNGAAIAAHATAVASVTVTNKGTDGSGTTVVAVITNDSDLADSATRNSAAYVANDALVVDLSHNNTSVAAVAGNEHISGTAIAAGSVLEVAVVNALGGATALQDFTVSLGFREGTN